MMAEGGTPGQKRRSVGDDDGAGLSRKARRSEAGGALEEEGDSAQGGSARRSSGVDISPDDQVNRRADKSRAPHTARDAEEGSEDDDGDEGDASGNTEIEDDADETFPYFNKLVLDNFQCHNKLTVDLGKKVNFVTGRNGTGKSACLQAIAIALGSQARDQARMNSIKEYVGPFHNKAVIHLHVIQPKDDMYKGKSAKGERFDLDQEIIIERTIAKGPTGASSLKLLNSRKKVLSTSREDLQNILSHLNIQPDNPVQFLQQNHSKAFLQKAKPDKYYEYFFKATGLEKQWVLLSETKESINMLADRKGEMEREDQIWLKNNYAPRKDAYEATADIRRQEKENEEILAKMAWAYLEQTREEKRKEEDNFKQYKATQEKLEAKISKADDQEKEATAELDELAARADKIKKKAEEHSLEIHSAKQYEKSQRALLAQAKRDQLSVKNEEASVLLAIKRLEGEKRDKENQAAEARAAKSGGRVVDVSAMEDKLQTLKEQQRADEEAKRADEDKLNRARAALKEAERNAKTANSKMQEARRAHEAVSRQQQNNPLAILGPDVPKVVDAFKQEFQYPPFGPLAQYIEIRENQEGWSDAVCAVLQQLATTFLCKDMEMKRKAEGVVRRVHARLGNGRGQICLKLGGTGRDFGADTKIESEYGPSLLDVLDIKHENQQVCKDIEAYLIDTFGVNEIRLVKSIDKGTAYMNSKPDQTITLSNGVTHRVRKECFCFSKEANRAVRRLFKKGKYPGSSEVRETSNIFTRDLAKAREDTRRNYEKAKDWEQSAKNQAEEAKKALDAAVKPIQAIMKETRARSSDIEKLEEKIDEEKRRREELRDDDEIDQLYSTEPIERDLIQQERKLGGIRTRAKEHEDKVVECDRLFKEAERRYDELARRSGQDNEESLEISQEKTKIVQKIGKMQQDKARYRAKFAEERNAADQSVKRIKAFNNKLPDLEESAKGLGPHCVPEESYSELSTLLDEKKAKLEKMKKRNQGDETLANQFPLYEHMWKARKLNKRRVETYYESFSSAIKKRRKYFKQCRNLNDAAFGMYFMKNLTQRGFNGAVDFDHKERNLTLKVTPKSHGAASASAVDQVSVDRLSGGERSFSTLCVVLSLKETVHSPFLGMDEFDVFMDDANRVVSLDMLCKVLKKATTQAIIISPHSMDKISDTDPDIKKIKMPDRDMGQQTL